MRKRKMIKGHDFLGQPLEEKKTLPFPVAMAEVFNQGYTLIDFLESLKWFYFEPLGYTTEDYDMWIVEDLKKGTIETHYLYYATGANMSQEIVTTHTYPENVFQAIEIMDKFFWSYGQEEPMGEEEKADIISNYGKHLIRKNL